MSKENVHAERNPHAGTPFADDDAAIATALEDVSTPPLLCSLVHMTGDPAWIRGDLRPRYCSTTEYHGGMSPEMRAEVRRRAGPAIAAYRDAGCQPHPLPRALLSEMMDFVACGPVDDERASMFLHDLAFDGGDADAVTWADQIPEDVKRDAHVVIIGCGEAGVLAAVRVAQAGLPFTIIEKGPGPGGTWRDNRYPGARVDVGSHHYCYSFEPADHWSEYFCRQPELEAYFTHIFDKHGLRPHARFDTEVTAAVWDDAAGSWSVGIRSADGTDETLTARFVVSAVGALNLPRLPNIAGMESFEGPAFHSSRWPAGLDITGTRFALLGAGATGFQIAPTIADDVAELAIFQRTPQWMLPNPSYHAAVPPGDQWAMRHLPFYGRWFRFMMMWPGIALGVEPFRRQGDYDDAGGRAVNELNEKTRVALTRWITSHLDGRPDLIEKSVPSYPAMAKRILQDNGSWFECLKKPNVELVRTAIDRIVPNGIVTVDGTLHRADVICYATGFRHNEYLAPIEFTGRGGVSLREQWGDEPTAYLGITMPSFPNLFCLYGPGTNLAHGASIIFHSECQMTYTMSAIHEVLANRARSIEVRKDVHDEYAARYEQAIAQLVWAHPSVEHSHYKNADGRIFTLSPWPIETYWNWTRSINPDDYVLA
jgi:4-hydroxyacetophenone monooxygenase